MLVYKQYDQAALDRQYNNRVHVPDFEIHLKRWNLLSRQTEKELRVIKDLQYGSLPREQLDIYPSPQPSSKTLIFIHGGYWHKWGKEDFQFLAKAFHDYGVTTVLINYPLAPEVSMDQIVKSCRDAVCWISKYITVYNGDPGQLYIAGHSAGGQLAAMLLATAPIATGRENANAVADIIQGVCAISGLFNLIPIHLSDINEVLNMDKEITLRNSPIQYIPASQPALSIVVGGDETDEFLDQSRELYTYWKENIETEIVHIQGLNHYSIVETMLDRQSSLHKEMLRIMKM
jgi:arylformamidase